MKKLLLSAVVLAFLFVGAQAQVTFGPKVGLNIANIGGDNTDDAKMKMGMQIGVMANFGFSDAISLQTGLVFSQKGSKSEMDVFGETYTMKTKLNYLELPINAVYGLDLGGNQLQFFAGPYLAYGIGGKFTSDADGSEDVDVQFVSDAVDADADKIPVAPLDFGFNIGAGYKINNIQIQANYGLGLSNLNPKVDGEKADDKNTNRVIQFSVAYFFGN